MSHQKDACHSNISKSEVENIAYLDRVFSVLRHELGNAVHAMVITLDVLMENYERWDDDKRWEYLQKLTSLVMRPERFVEAMVQYSGFNAGKAEPIESTTLLEKIVPKISARCKDNIRFNPCIETAPCRVNANPAAVEKAVMNIIENAIDALSKAEKPSIDLLTETTNDTLAIWIKDNGSAIESRDLCKVFLPFFSTKPGHMGMGLPVAKRLLVQMNGGIDIESKKDSGTRVLIRLVAS